MAGRAGQIAIAGAGVAGLAAAIAFSRAGFCVRLFERAEKLQEVGAGLQLSPNATRILDRLGVLAVLSPLAVRPRMIDIRKASTLAPLAAVPLGEAAERRWRAPYLTAHRADLQAALLEVASRQDRIDIVTGAAASRIVATGDGVTLTLDRAGQARDEPCLLAVGADGVWSRLRRAAGQGGASRYTGYLAWRAMASPAAGSSGDIVAADRVSTFVHPGFHLVAYPVRAGAAVNLVAVTKSPATPEHWSSDADARSLVEAIAGAAPALVDLVLRAGPWTTWPIHEVAREGAWTDPAGMALIGDAAHAMSPYAAQGAAMAIEDAASLAACVQRSPADLAAALGTWEARRRRRVERVAARGRFNRFTWHASGPVALARDLVLSRRSSESLAADLDWLYGYDAEKDERIESSE